MPPPLGWNCGRAAGQLRWYWRSGYRREPGDRQPRQTDGRLPRLPRAIPTHGRTATQSRPVRAAYGTLKGFGPRPRSFEPTLISVVGMTA
jgi:hypothetical protein